jgi:putative ABC transport system ATP-binding protein
VKDLVLEADAVSKIYGQQTVIDSITLAVHRGDLLAITGPSGSGKSTLLLCLAGILDLDKGVVRFQGRALAERSEAELSRLRRSSFGVLFQFGQLIPEITAAENVALPLLLQGQRRAIALKTSHAMLQRLSVADLAQSRPSDISGGQAQRVAMARAMVTKPAVLFADEPTGALDSRSGEMVLNELTALAREHGTAVVLATHDQSVAAKADRVIELRDGVFTHATGTVARA